MPEFIDGIVQDLRNGTVVGVSHDSFKNKRATACWILENASGSERIVDLVEVPGHDDEHDAYRSELTGLFGLVVAVQILMNIGKCKQGKWRLDVPG